MAVIKEKKSLTLIGHYSWKVWDFVHHFGGGIIHSRGEGMLPTCTKGGSRFVVMIDVVLSCSCPCMLKLEHYSSDFLIYGTIIQYMLVPLQLQTVKFAIIEHN